MSSFQGRVKNAFAEKSLWKVNRVPGAPLMERWAAGPVPALPSVGRRTPCALLLTGHQVGAGGGSTRDPDLRLLILKLMFLRFQFQELDCLDTPFPALAAFLNVGIVKKASWMLPLVSICALCHFEDFQVITLQDAD